MTKLNSSLTLAKKIVAEAKKELTKEKEENLKKQAKQLLADIQEAKRTTSLLERQLNNFMREVDLA
jgi:F0F1-type ATP synthase membrane subunit b/b'